MVQTKVYSSNIVDTQQALIAIGTELRRDGFEPDSALVFASVHHANHGSLINDALTDILGNAPFLGWFGTSAYDHQQLSEWQPAVALLAFKGIKAHVQASAPEDLGAHVGVSLLADSPTGAMRFLAASGARLEPKGLLATLDEQPVPLAGAISLSPKNAPDLLICSDQQGSGTLGAAMATFSRLSMTTSVAQGTKILGEKHRVTQSRANHLLALDGTNALEVLMSELPETLQEKLPSLGGQLFAGLSTPDGDSWLMRNVVGIDPQQGVLVLADVCPEGSELAFFILDSQAAQTNMQEAILELKAALGDDDPLAVVVFNCASRNQTLLGESLYDVAAIESAFSDDMPLVGVAGGGEFSTVGRQSHLFQYCSVIAALTLQDAPS
ncbi:MAG: hypothetical protein CMH56_05615 [Myxococcales bacterium]|nr:hypothetical protein [Myxococcales bacterium]|tara:strand:+ start:1010 stop:2155 length:1146 start_codon:yes stop_codon:yes gene_type:complete